MRAQILKLLDGRFREAVDASEEMKIKCFIQILSRRDREVLSNQVWGRVASGLSILSGHDVGGNCGISV